MRALVDLRLEDARALLAVSVQSKQPQRRNGAVYLGGYAVECALKARICADRRTRTLEAQYFTHDLERLAQATTASLALAGDLSLRRRFVRIISTWDVSLRYTARHWDAAEVERFLTMVKDLTQWLFASWSQPKP